MRSAITTRRVLVVDDEPNILDVLGRALRFGGFAITAAGTGAAALAALAREPADLVILT